MKLGNLKYHFILKAIVAIFGDFFKLRNSFFSELLFKKQGICHKNEVIFQVF